jgi:hypothetical protein
MVGSQLVDLSELIRINYSLLGIQLQIDDLCNYLKKFGFKALKAEQSIH